ncbi:hypothetical protein AB0L70_17185 [Kribbella sp. NPDC051952]|uniref:hypothetical protein n=1 Tax=Kribbella sp. NPDC051952 TaxID=3154851 RepID=UPI00343BE672
MDDLLGRLVELPLGHELVAACRMKAVACVAGMLVAGESADSLGIAANLVPDMSVEGMERAYASGQVMRREQSAFSRSSFQTRLNHHPGVVDTEDAEVVLDGSIRVRAEQGVQGPGVHVQHVDTDNGWWLADTTEPGQQFGNHFAAVRFHAPADRGEPVPMVYDPGYDNQDPLTVTEWKARQGYPDSVAAVARLDGPYRLHLESMSDVQRARLAALGTTEHNDLLREFFRFPPEGDRSYASDIRDLIVVEEAMPGVTDDPAAVLRATLRELVPLATYERWLHDTDARIRLSAPSASPAVVQATSSTTPTRRRGGPSDREPRER